LAINALGEINVPLLKRVCAADYRTIGIIYFIFGEFSWCGKQKKIVKGSALAINTFAFRAV